jgi:hypothetical protein
MLPRLHSDRLGMRLASSKNYQPNAASLSLTMCSSPCTSPASNGPGLVEGPVFWLSSIVCRCRQGLPSRSESRIARTDRGYYWKISAELNSLVLLLCLSTSCAVSTHRIGLAHIHHPLRSARCLDPQVLLIVVPKTHSPPFPVSKQNNKTVTACDCVCLRVQGGISER